MGLKDGAGGKLRKVVRRQMEDGVGGGAAKGAWWHQEMKKPAERSNLSSPIRKRVGMVPAPSQPTYSPAWFTLKDLPPNLLMFCHSILQKGERGIDWKWKTTYSNWDLIALWAVFLCAWCQMKKWRRERMSWVLSYESLSLCSGMPAMLAVCSHKVG